MKLKAGRKIGSDDKRKVAIIYGLYATAVAITASGAFFCVYSYLKDITFKVINTNVSGMIFGVVVAYLGVRYFLSVQKLKAELYEPDAQFSWSNFRKHRVAKSR